MYGLRDVIPAVEPWKDLDVRVLKACPGRREKTAQTGVVTDGYSSALLVVWKKAVEAGVPELEEGKCYHLENARLWLWNGQLQVTVNSNTAVYEIEQLPPLAAPPALPLGDKVCVAGRIVPALGHTPSGYSILTCDFLSSAVYFLPGRPRVMSLADLEADTISAPSSLPEEAVAGAVLAHRMLNHLKQSLSPALPHEVFSGRDVVTVVGVVRNDRNAPPKLTDPANAAPHIAIVRNGKIHLRKADGAEITAWLVDLAATAIVRDDGKLMDRVERYAEEVTCTC